MKPKDKLRGDLTTAITQAVHCEIAKYVDDPNISTLEAIKCITLAAGNIIGSYMKPEDREPVSIMQDALTQLAFSALEFRQHLFCDGDYTFHMVSLKKGQSLQ